MPAVLLIAPALTAVRTPLIAGSLVARAGPPYACRPARKPPHVRWQYGAWTAWLTLLCPSTGDVSVGRPCLASVPLIRVP